MQRSTPQGSTPQPSGPAADFDWGDLRIVLAIAREGSLAAAARVLGLDRSTVFRRLGGFETALGVRLFERLPDGLVPTEAGEEMRAIAGRVEDECIALARAIAGRARQLTGTVRVATTDSIAFGVLPPHLARFRAAHPGIKVELVATPRLLSITRREADVALLATRSPDPALVGRRLCGMAVAIYGAASYLAARGRPQRLSDLDDHAIIASDESLSHFQITRWLAENILDTSVIYRTNSLLMQLAAVQAGVGLAYLPCFLADPLPEIVRVFPADVGIGTDLWLATHEDLRRTARVRAFLDFMAESIPLDRDFLEGRGPRRVRGVDPDPAKRSAGARRRSGRASRGGTSPSARG